MRVFITSILLTCLIISCENEKSNKIAEYQEIPIENFDTFYAKFTTDSVFQVSRIVYPLYLWGLSYQAGDEIPPGMEDVLIPLDTFQKENHHFIDFSTTTDQPYDNFTLSLQKAKDSVVATFSGINNGIYTQFLFKPIGIEWYMTRIIDYSN